MNGKDVLVSWLNDAYAMENALAQILQKQLNDAENFPEVQARLQQHLEVTKQHADLVKSCVNRLGGDTSTLKSALGSIMGAMQGMSTGAAEDRVVKDALADFAAENFEVASYTSIITAAQELGDTKTATTCEQIRRQDADMAQWLQQHIAQVTTLTLEKMTAGATG